MYEFMDRHAEHAEAESGYQKSSVKYKVKQRATGSDL